MKKNINNIWKKWFVNVFAAVILYVLIFVFISLVRIYFNIFYSRVGEMIFIITINAMFLGILIILMGSKLFSWLRKTAAWWSGYSKENENSKDMDDDGIIPDEKNKAFICRSPNDTMPSVGEKVLFYKVSSKKDKTVKNVLLLNSVSSISDVKECFPDWDFEFIGWCRVPVLADFLI